MFLRNIFTSNMKSNKDMVVLALLKKMPKIQQSKSLALGPRERKGAGHSVE